MSNTDITKAIMSDSMPTALRRFEWFEDSDIFCTRLKLVINEEYQISIIRGQYTYGGRDGQFEMALFSKQHGLIHTPFYEDTVQGYLTEPELFQLMTKVIEWIESGEINKSEVLPNHAD